jgi:hypothetical protein
LSNGKRSASNYHVETFYKTPKKRRLIEATDVGHKSPVVKNRKSLFEHGSGMKKKPNKLQSSKSDGDLLNVYDDSVMSDDAKSCLSDTDDNGLSIPNSDEDDAFGFPN